MATPKITGNTALLAHIGYPTGTFKAPMIYNPYFAKHGIDAVVVPMGVTADGFDAAFPVIAGFSNFAGALITMPHKVAVVGKLDRVSAAVRVAGSCNAVRRAADGALEGDMFDGEGFVRGITRKGCTLAGARVLVVGAGGVGSAIAASLAGAGIAAISLFDVNSAAAEGLGQRLKAQYPAIHVTTGSNDPAGYDVLVNATPLGMNKGDPMPMDMSRVSPESFVGEVVMKQETTAFLDAALARGCRVQVGVDMLFEQIPAYLEFFGLGTTTAEELRSTAEISY